MLASNMEENIRDAIGAFAAQAASDIGIFIRHKVYVRVEGGDHPFKFSDGVRVLLRNGKLFVAGSYFRYAHGWVYAVNGAPCASPDDSIRAILRTPPPPDRVVLDVWGADEGVDAEGWLLCSSGGRPPERRFARLMGPYLSLFLTEPSETTTPPPVSDRLFLPQLHAAKRGPTRAASTTTTATTCVLIGPTGCLDREGGAAETTRSVLCGPAPVAKWELLPDRPRPGDDPDEAAAVFSNISDTVLGLVNAFPVPRPPLTAGEAESLPTALARLRSQSRLLSRPRRRRGSRAARDAQVLEDFPCVHDASDDVAWHRDVLGSDEESSTEAGDGDAPQRDETLRELVATAVFAAARFRQGAVHSNPLRDSSLLDTTRPGAETKGKEEETVSEDVPKWSVEAHKESGSQPLDHTHAAGRLSFCEEKAGGGEVVQSSSLHLSSPSQDTLAGGGEPISRSIHTHRQAQAVVRAGKGPIGVAPPAQMSKFDHLNEFSSEAEVHAAFANLGMIHGTLPTSRDGASGGAADIRPANQSTGAEMTTPTGRNSSPKAKSTSNQDQALLSFAARLHTVGRLPELDAPITNAHQGHSLRRRRTESRSDRFMVGDIPSSEHKQDSGSTLRTLNGSVPGSSMSIGESLRSTQGTGFGRENGGEEGGRRKESRAMSRVLRVEMNGVTTHISPLAVLQDRDRNLTDITDQERVLLQRARLAKQQEKYSAEKDAWSDDDHHSQQIPDEKDDARPETEAERRDRIRQRVKRGLRRRQSVEATKRWRRAVEAAAGYERDTLDAGAALAGSDDDRSDGTGDDALAASLAYSGWLHKRRVAGGNLARRVFKPTARAFRRRFFILRRDTLYYFSRQVDVNEAKTSDVWKASICGSHSLRGAISVTSAPYKMMSDVMSVKLPTETLLLAPTNDDEGVMWLQVLSVALRLFGSEALARAAAKKKRQEAEREARRKDKKRGKGAKKAKAKKKKSVVSRKTDGGSTKGAAGDDRGGSCDEDQPDRVSPSGDSSSRRRGFFRGRAQSNSQWRSSESSLRAEERNVDGTDSEDEAAMEAAAKRATRARWGILRWGKRGTERADQSAQPMSGEDAESLPKSASQAALHLSGRQTSRQLRPPATNARPRTGRELWGRVRSANRARAMFQHVRVGGANGEVLGEGGRVRRRVLTRGGLRGRSGDAEFELRRGVLHVQVSRAFGLLGKRWEEAAAVVTVGELAWRAVGAPASSRSTIRFDPNTDPSAGSDALAVGSLTAVGGARRSGQRSAPRNPPRAAGGALSRWIGTSRRARPVASRPRSSELPQASNGPPRSRPLSAAARRRAVQSLRRTRSRAEPRAGLEHGGVGGSSTASVNASESCTGTEGSPSAGASTASMQLRPEEASASETQRRSSGGQPVPNPVVSLTAPPLVLGRLRPDVGQGVFEVALWSPGGPERVRAFVRSQPGACSSALFRAASREDAEAWLQSLLDPRGAHQLTTAQNRAAAAATLSALAARHWDEGGAAVREAVLRSRGGRVAGTSGTTHAAELLEAARRGQTGAGDGASRLPGAVARALRRREERMRGAPGEPAAPNAGGAGNATLPALQSRRASDEVAATLRRAATAMTAARALGVAQRSTAQVAGRQSGGGTGSEPVGPAAPGGDDPGGSGDGDTGAPPPPPLPRAHGTYRLRPATERSTPPRSQRMGVRQARSGKRLPQGQTASDRGRLGAELLAMQTAPSTRSRSNATGERPLVQAEDGSTTSGSLTDDEPWTSDEEKADGPSTRATVPSWGAFAVTEEAKMPKITTNPLAGLVASAE